MFLRCNSFGWDAGMEDKQVKIDLKKEEEKGNHVTILPY